MAASHQFERNDIAPVGLFNSCTQDYICCFPCSIKNLLRKRASIPALVADVESSGPGSAQRQADVLQSEGVEVTTDSMGEMYVSLAQYGWFPSHLPSEQDEDESENSQM